MLVFVWAWAFILLQNIQWKEKEIHKSEVIYPLGADSISRLNEPPLWALKETSGFLTSRHKPKPKSRKGFGVPPPTEQKLSPSQAFLRRLSGGIVWKNMPALQRVPWWYNCQQNPWGSVGCGDHSYGDEKRAKILHMPLIWHELCLWKEWDGWKYPHLWHKGNRLFTESSKMYRLEVPWRLPTAQTFSWPTCTNRLHFSIPGEWTTSWQIQATCDTLPSWAAWQPARLWVAEPGLAAQCQAQGKGKAHCCSMLQCKTCQDGQTFPHHSSSDSLSCAMLIIHKLSVQ